MDALAAHKLICPPLKEGFIFRTSTGAPADPDNFRTQRWPKILEEAGLPHVGFHSLRHTYASLLIAQGENLKFVQEQLGHASIQMTADVYGHLLEATRAASMEKLEAASWRIESPRKPRPLAKADRVVNQV